MSYTHRARAVAALQVKLTRAGLHKTRMMSRNLVSPELSSLLPLLGSCQHVEAWDVEYTLYCIPCCRII